MAPREAAADLAVLISLFRERRARIGVIGLGYVGLPLLCAVADRGFLALGFDIDQTKVETLNAGGSYIKHIAAENIARFREESLLAATADFSRLTEVDAIILCVPTPLTRQREPDLTFIVRTTEAIAARLRPGQLVVLEIDDLSGDNARGDAVNFGTDRSRVRPRFLSCLFA